MIDVSAPRDAGLPLRAAGSTPPAPPNGATDGADESGTVSAGGLSFWDLLDVVNPLQHIPIISTIYRKITGDEISPIARVAGATLFGGPIGAAFALVDAAIEHKTGRDIGANAMAALFPDKPQEAPATAIAQAPASPPVHGFAPRIEDPIQLVPSGAAQGSSAKAFVAPAAPDLQSLGAPISLDPPSNAPARTWIKPAQDLPKGAAASLSRQAMRAYANSTGMTAAPPPPSPVPKAAVELERETEAAQNDWILESMMRAHDKYGESKRLQSNPAAAPTHAVWR